MASAAMQEQTFGDQERYAVAPNLSLAPNLPLVIAVPELERDEYTRYRSARFIGKVLSEGLVDSPLELAVERPIESLHEAVERAHQGDETAKRMVETNVRTDVIERTIKTGHVISIDMVVDAQQGIVQHGQRLETVQANSLKYAAGSEQMMERTKAEARNSFRLDEAYRSGELEEYSFFVISRAADNMTDTQMTDAGFFVDTMSCALQLTYIDGEVMRTESAFVAGIAGEGEARHDEATVIELGRLLGVDLAGKSAAEIIDTPLLVHNSLIEHGVIDLVALYDQAAGGRFFGEDKPQQDYATYRELCREREKDFAPKVAEITRQLIAEAPTITTPLQAVRRLHDLSEKHMVEQAVSDKTIDARVFGAVAAGHIEEARRHQELGNRDQALVSIREAKQTAVSSSCPSALKDKSRDDNELGQDGTDENLLIGKKERMTCPFCGDKNQSGDPCSPNQYCYNCTAEVRNGKVHSEGNGGRKAEKRQSSMDRLKELLKPILADVVLIDEKRHAKAATQQVKSVAV